MRRLSSEMRPLQSQRDPSAAPLGTLVDVSAIEGDAGKAMGWQRKSVVPEGDLRKKKGTYVFLYPRLLYNQDCQIVPIAADSLDRNSSENLDQIKIDFQISVPKHGL